MRLLLVALATLVACSGHRVIRGPVPRCDTAQHPGVTSRSLAWNGAGWGAVVPDGSRLYLREFTVEGADRGTRVELLEVPSQPAPTALAWVGDGYIVASHASGTLRLLRSTVTAPAGEVFAVDVPHLEDLALVSRALASAPAALFLVERAQPSLRLVARDGEPSTPLRCPNGLLPRTVVAWRSGFRALSEVLDPHSGDGVAIDLLALDDECAVTWRMRLWEGTVNGRTHGLAVDEEGTVAVFSDREGGTWLAAVDHDGAFRLRATRIERQARDPRVFVQTTEDGRRTGIQVVAVRSLETGDRLALWRFAPDGVLRDIRELTTSPAIEVLVSSPDPWGGGLVGYSRGETFQRSPHNGAGRYGFFTRICP
jgi:hypothetical protein